MAASLLSVAALLALLSVASTSGAQAAATEAADDRGGRGEGEASVAGDIQDREGVSGIKDLSNLAEGRQSHVRELTQENADVLRERSHDMLLEFHSHGCELCKEFEPEFEAVAEALLNSSVIVAKVDCGAQPELCALFRVRRFPTLKWLPKDGGRAPVDYEGALSRSAVLWFVYMKTGFLSSVRAFAESYGWLTLGTVLLLLWLRHRAREAYHRYQQSRPEDLARVRELERAKEGARRRQQESAEVARQRWLEESAERDEESRRRRIAELDAKASRYGMRPRGTGHRLGA